MNRPATDKARAQPDPATKPKLHFSRFEFKYVLSAARRAEVEADLQHFVELDPFVAAREGNEYPVRSLYFDDPHLTAFHDKIEGLHSRSKFRVRTYSFSQTEVTAWFLEVKGRFNNLVYKHRIPLPQNDRSNERLRGDALSDHIASAAPEGDLRTQFTYERFRRRLRPNALVDYNRRAYVSRFDPEFRLTFDRGIAATQTDRIFPEATARRRAVLQGFTVMEVKFKRHVPFWFHRIIQGRQLERRSVSKICHALESLGLATDN